MNRVWRPSFGLLLLALLALLGLGRAGQVRLPRRPRAERTVAAAPSATAPAVRRERGLAESVRRFSAEAGRPRTVAVALAGLPAPRLAAAEVASADLDRDGRDTLPRRLGGTHASRAPPHA